MKRTLSFALIFLQISLFVTACGIYSIVAPGTLQPNYDYTVSVTLHKHFKPAFIKVGLVGPSYKDTKIIFVFPSQTKAVHFKVPQLKEGTYHLETEDLLDRPWPKVYIQTDKATYKPGDLVQFRIVILDENTRPAKLKQYLRLSFKDGAGNFIKQINDIKLYNGVYSGEFQLSEEPVLGNWMMEVSLGPNDDDIKTEKKFEVAKYVLPKFSVEIETAKDISYDRPLKITVRSKYTYDKPVKGKATVKVDAQNGQAISEKIIDIDGKGDVEFDLFKDLNLEVPTVNDRFGYFYYFYTPPLNILAIMTEEFTGNSQNTTATVTLHRSRYNIEVLNYVYEYCPNIPFELEVFVKNLDGSPVQDGKDMAKLIIDKQQIYYYDGSTPPPSNEEGFEFASELDKNGKAVFKVTLPKIDYYFNVRVTYADQMIYLPSLSEFVEKKPTDVEDVGPLKLTMKTEKPQLGEDVVVEVESNKYICYYVYAIVARGNIIKQEHVKLRRRVKSHEIKFKPSFEMVPQSYLYVYFVRGSDFTFQELYLSFPREFQNKIEITAPKVAKPSEEVTINIKTDPNSFVGLLGVDQSVILLQSGNDFDPNQIFNELSSYDTSTPYISGYGDYPGRPSGLVTLTNANYPYYTEDFIYFLEKTELNPIPGSTQIIPSATEITAQNSEPSPLIRKNFEEVWIYQILNGTDANGLASLTKNIPDTITSWVVTGFSLNDKTGFGMVANPTNITVFQPFFISTNLPYSIQRGEIIAIQIVVFNYMENTLDAEVTMENIDFEYDFVEVFNALQETVLEENEIVKQVSVPPNSGITVSFMIRPNKIGDISLKFKAIAAMAGDIILQKIKVVAEGFTQYGNQAIFLTPSNELLKETLTATIPKEVVSGSEHLEISAVADILGPSIKNLDSLVRLPYGCGEQNMMNFVPNILVLYYLDAIKRDMPTVVQKAKNYMEIGYQRELTYKHKNGAYSAFGEGSSDPSSWLTAYVARSFIQAKRYITIDQNVIDQALTYLVSTQLASGQFEQTGHLFHPAHQNNYGFTAFALLALLEETDNNKYKSEIDKGIKYLVDNIDNENDTYALAIAAVVLKKTQHPSAANLMEKLEKLAKEENGLKWWTKSSQDTSNDIEITAYILQACAYSEPAGKLLPILKWLIGKRNSLGGFESTQDTVVGLQALIEFAEKFISAGDGKMTINFKAQDSEGKETTTGSFTVDKENSLILQTHVLAKSSRKITLEAIGEGSCLIQFSYRYNLVTKDDKPSFAIKHTINETPFPKIFQMTVCAEFVPGDKSDLKESNMVVMEIYLPSGFTFYDILLKPKEIQRVETKNLDTAIFIYFEYLEVGKEICFDVSAEKTYAVAKQKPSVINIYDYYNRDQRATVYYIAESSLCEICEKGQCGNCSQ